MSEMSLSVIPESLTPDWRAELHPWLSVDECLGPQQALIITSLGLLSMACLVSRCKSRERVPQSS